MTSKEELIALAQKTIRSLDEGVAIASDDARELADGILHYFKASKMMNNVTPPQGHPGFPEAVAMCESFEKWNGVMLSLGHTRPCDMKDHQYCNLERCEEGRRLSWSRISNIVTTG